MLKLPPAARNRYDVSSLEFAVHAAAPCPAQVKRDMIEWWGPIIHEYYGATEGLGFAACDAGEWLQHPGTVGRVLLGELHILDDDMWCAAFQHNIQPHFGRICFQKNILFDERRYTTCRYTNRIL